MTTPTVIPDRRTALRLRFQLMGLGILDLVLPMVVAGALGVIANQLVHGAPDILRAVVLAVLGAVAAATVNETVAPHLFMPSARRAAQLYGSSIWYCRSCRSTVRVDSEEGR